MNSRLLAEIKNERQQLAQYEKEAQRRLAKAPEGSLRVSSAKDRVMFYHRTDKKNTTGTYLGRNKRELIEALAQKAYDASLLEQIESEAELLDRLIAINESGNSLDKAYESLTPARKDLVVPYRQRDDVERVTWPLHVFPRLDPPSEDEAIITNRGEKVRSKSEAIIANSLNELGVPYRYEQTLELSQGVTTHPDFTILRLSDHKTLIWEHFGMMDNPDYCASALRKIKAYQKAGYIQGVNMVMTFESPSAPLDARAIKQIIQELLL